MGEGIRIVRCPAPIGVQSARKMCGPAQPGVQSANKVKKPAQIASTNDQTQLQV